MTYAIIENYLPNPLFVATKRTKASDTFLKHLLPELEKEGLNITVFDEKEWPKKVKQVLRTTRLKSLATFSNHVISKALGCSEGRVKGAI